MTFAPTWMDLKIIILSEVRQRKTNTVLTRNLKNDTNELIYKTDRLTDLENKLMFTKWERRGEGHIRRLRLTYTQWKWKWSRSVMSNSSWPLGLQPTRLLPPWDFPGKSTGVGCHCLLQTTAFQSRSVAQSCLTLCDPMNRSTPGLPVYHQRPEFTQTHVHRVSDAIQPSHPLSSPSPPAPYPSQHQSLFQWVNSLHEVAKVLEFQL